ncbi:MAG: thioredoxin [Dehalococcoidia bacterium]|nr:thioredoxin [Dehalococcoidia bacterium]
MAKRNVCLALVAALIVMLSVATACPDGDSTTGTPPSTEAPDVASTSLEDALTNGIPTLAGFVGPTCACKNMTPILEELAAEYEGKLNVVIVDVYDHKDLASQHQIVMIPTQIIFDSNGEEATRQIGALPKEAIISQLKKMGML